MNNDIVIDSEYAYIQTFIYFFQEIIDIVAGIFEKIMGAVK